MHIGVEAVQENLTWRQVGADRNQRFGELFVVGEGGRTSIHTQIRTAMHRSSSRWMRKMRRSEPSKIDDR